MKSAKSILLLFLILSNSILFCGCWNYHDIEKLFLVSGFAIDKNEQGDKYLVTAEIVDFEMVGREAKQTGKFVEFEGKTIFDAVRNAIDVTGKRLYWAHANVVIISQDIAKEGLTPVIDLILRNPEIREEMYALISKEKTAKEVLEQELLLSQISANNIEAKLSNQKSVGHAYPVQAYELVSTLESEGISVSLPAIHLTENAGKKTAEIAGTALFKSDKLVGFLDTDETKYFLFIINKMSKGSITLNENSSNQMDNIALEIFETKTKAKPEISNKKLTINIDITSEVAIAEIATSVDYIKEKNQDKLKKDAEKKVKSEVEKVIKKVQNDYDTDIFGFGVITKAYMPSVWKSAQHDRKNLFKELEANVKVDIAIQNSAHTSKPIKKGD